MASTLVELGLSRFVKGRQTEYGNISNGFNSNDEFWPLALKQTDKTPIVLYKMNNPIGATALWKNIKKVSHGKNYSSY